MGRKQRKVRSKPERKSVEYIEQVKGVYPHNETEAKAQCNVCGTSMIGNLFTISGAADTYFKSHRCDLANFLQRITGKKHAVITTDVYIHCLKAMDSYTFSADKGRDKHGRERTLIIHASPEEDLFSPWGRFLVQDYPNRDIKRVVYSMTRIADGRHRVKREDLVFAGQKDKTKQKHSHQYRDKLVKKFRNTAPRI